MAGKSPGPTTPTAGAGPAPPRAGTPACAVEVDMDLIHHMEALFYDSDAIVLCAFEVMRIKDAEATTGTSLLKALGAKGVVAGRHPPAPRVLCLTVRRGRPGKDEPAYEPYLHLVTPVDSETYQVRHTHELHELQAVRLAGGKPLEYGGTELQVVELLIQGARASGGGGTADVSQRYLGAKAAKPVCFGFLDMEHVHAFLAVSVQLLKQTQHPVPALTGIDIATITTWWAGNAAGLVAQLGPFSGEVLLSDAGGGEGDDAHARVLISAKEEKDLEDLLDLYSMGMCEVAQFDARLSAEYAALEDANIHSLLSNHVMVDNVVLQLRRTTQMLEDLDELLQVFDVKLRHMKQDISAIEKYNNALELTATNNTKLLTAVKGLLSDIKISSDTRAGLMDPGFEKDKLSSVMKSGWVLAHKLARFTPGHPNSLNSNLMKMRVVREARAEMVGLAKGYVSKAAAHLTARINQAVDELNAETAKATDKVTRTKAPDHTRLQQVRSRHVELVQLIQALDPGALEAFRAAYTRSVNMLVRKEMRAAVNELRKAAALDAQQQPLDFSLTKDIGRAAGAVLIGGSEGASVVSDLDHVQFGRGGPGSSVSRISKSTAGTTTSLRMVLRARTNAGDGTTLALPLNEAWSVLLDAWLPFLLEELQAAATFLRLHADAQQDAAGKKPGARPPGKPAPLDPAAWSVLQSLVSGLEAELQVLVDVCGKGTQQVVAVPMLGSTTWWLQQLLPAPEAAPLVQMLAQCHSKLAAHLHTYKTSQQQALESYVSKAASGVKLLHVLPCTYQFSLLTHYLEQLLAEQADVQRLMAAQANPSHTSRTQSAPLPAWITDWAASAASPPDQPPSSGKASRVSGGGRGPVPGQPDAQEQELGVRIAASWQCRLEVDELYQSLVGSMFHTIDSMAGLDPKHGQRLRLENYAYFSESLRPLLRHVRALEPYLVQAEDRQEEAMSTYVQQQLEYGAIWKLLEFSQRIDKMMTVLSPHEVSFQSGCSAAEVKALIQASVKEPVKQLSLVSARVRKHLGASTLALKVWSCTQEQLLSRYGKLSKQLATCYPSGQIQLSPSPAELAELLSGVGLVA